MQHDVIGMICGNGMYPEIFAAAARKAGVKKLVASGFIDETKPELEKQIKKTQDEMVQAAKDFDFLIAARLRDQMTGLKKLLAEK